MKSRVENRNVRDVGKDSPCLPDADQVGWIVKRGKRDALLELGDHIVRDENRVKERLGAMNDPVSDCRYLRDTGQHSALGIEQGLPDDRESIAVGSNGHFPLDQTVSDVMPEAGAFFSYPRHYAFGQHAVKSNIMKLILDRRTAAVDDDDLHGSARPVEDFGPVRRESPGAFLVQYH